MYNNIAIFNRLSKCRYLKNLTNYIGKRNPNKRKWQTLSGRKMNKRRLQVNLRKIISSHNSVHLPKRTVTSSRRCGRKGRNNFMQSLNRKNNLTLNQTLSKRTNLVGNLCKRGKSANNRKKIFRFIILLFRNWELTRPEICNYKVRLHYR